MTGFRKWVRSLLDRDGGVRQAEVAATAQPAPLAIAPAEPALSPTERPAFELAWVTDVGRVRDHNEDGLFVFTGEQVAANAIVPFGLLVVADGMGGHQSGELASSVAMRIAAGQLLTHVYLPLLTGFDRTADQPSLREVLIDAISRANQVVTRDLPGSGCTLTCAVILGDRLYIGHVGDSRAYLLRPGSEPERLTKDHSFVGRLIEMGQLSEEDAASHPKRNVLYRAIGQPGGLEVDVTVRSLGDGDRVLLCSDGLWGMLDEATMWQLIEQSSSLQAACARLRDAANLAGGGDNITVLLGEVWPTRPNE